VTRRVAAVKTAVAALGTSVLLVLFAACALLVAGPAGAAAPAATPFDLAVGGSGSVGFQPTSTHPHGSPTESGYTDDLAAREATRWPGLTLVRIGCPGTTTLHMIDGGGNCSYPDGTQLQTALDFLRTHPSTVLLTVDLGFNDVVRCLHDMNLNSACVASGLTAVQLQLPRILAALRQAAPASAQIVGVGHYDPYLGDAVRGAAGQVFAQASLVVIERLNDIMRAAYAKAGIPMADVGAAFDLGDTTPVAMAGLGTVPTDVARACALTWMCAAPPMGPNQHPNDTGYRAIAAALATTLTEPARSD
jgi:lysophospholipase L1-like esterase